MSSRKRYRSRSSSGSEDSCSGVSGRSSRSDSEKEEVNTVEEIADDFFGDVLGASAVYDIADGPMVAGFGESVVPLAHHVMDNLGRWTSKRVEGHARIRLRVEVCRGA